MENWTMTRGDTLSFGVELYADKDCTAKFTQNIGAAYFVIKKGNTAVVTKSLASGITKKETGVYVVRADPTDTAGLALGEYAYEFRVELNDDKFTFLCGTLVIE
ncbi:MAG: hypothetical protein IIZ35_07020 [Clostridia bacterium]|nr:hypothetical protein [Clostridia bacterium]